ncbi:hypothetical protein M409DRAFT_58919 [Zasmidium cellare ATCC 36951]|uniref:Uncharacterized protein n=1 Tax=Zasmidium cellare ATCC 36951 TaxID=1080233 RepID=A0A6A6C3L8_ZASCE|nr:uncharacterized protein M409DRAFT_58919 [Zasmidium cellare ATCC 36951]KAF2161513.1 hypothetical protein M409DRAFT_58919 [Zasmidium cellare ATCC 36951]
MPDPFSVGGAVGLVAGLLGFIVSTIERTMTACDTAIWCLTALQCHYSRLRVLESRLACWKETYEPTPEVSNGSLESLFGETTSQEIRIIQRCVVVEIEQVKKLLYGAKILRNKADEATWQALLKHQEQKWPVKTSTTPMVHNQATTRLFHRVAVALWREKLLDVNMDRLSHFVNSMEHQSRVSYHRTRGSSEYEITPSRKDVLRALRVQARTIRLRGALQVAYDELGASQTWALLMPDMVKPDELKFDAVEKLRISFFSVPAFQSDEAGYRIDVLFHLELDDHVALAERMSAQLRQRRICASNGALGESLKSIFWCILSRPKKEHADYRDQTSLECARAALCIASWTTLVWGSRWIDGLCTCSIRFVSFTTGVRVLAYQPSPGHMGCTCSKTTDGGLHHQLGIVLAELALAQPVYAHTVASVNEYKLWDGEAEVRSIDSEDLLREIQKSTTTSYRDAVSYCLQRNGISEQGLSHSNHLAVQYTTNVVQPLWQHLRWAQEQ